MLRTAPVHSSLFLDDITSKYGTKSLDNGDTLQGDLPLSLPGLGDFLNDQHLLLLLWSREGA